MISLALLYEFGTLTEQTLFRLVTERVGVSNNPTSYRRRLYGYEREGLIETVSRDVIRQARGLKEMPLITPLFLPNLARWARTVSSFSSL
jgi:hypothetical protein